MKYSHVVANPETFFLFWRKNFAMREHEPYCGTNDFVFSFFELCMSIPFMEYGGSNQYTIDEPTTTTKRFLLASSSSS